MKTAAGFDRRAAERDAAIVDALRPEIFSEVVYRDGTSQRRTVAIDAFIDAGVDRLIEARLGGEEDALRAWLCDAADDTALAIGSDVVSDLCAVLEATMAHNELAAPGLRAALRAAAEHAARRAPVPDTRSVQTIDEIDARIDNLIAQLEDLDLLTAEHSRAVASWCVRLARRLRLSEDEVRLMRRSGLLHDVGKLKIPKDVLNAPRALSESEWRIVRAHTVAGEAIVKKDAMLRDSLPAIRSHHERFTGGGYPDGLHGEAIPFAARLVAVADSFNAMIGRRPYRPPMLPSKAVEELRAGRGRQFDPELVDAMEAVVLRGGGLA